MLQPLNKYLVVRQVEEKKVEDVRILLPQETKLNNFTHKVVEVLAPHADSNLKKGMKLLVPSSSVEEAVFLGETYHIVPENHVIGFFRDDARG